MIAHFGTKEDLDLAVLQTAANLFGKLVIVPAYKANPGEARLRTLFDGWFRYVAHKQPPGGDLFLAAATELDDRPGVCRYYVGRVFKDWITALESATRETMAAKEFRDDLDPSQIAFNVVAVLHAYNTYHRLLNEGNAEARTRAAFESLMARARADDRGPPVNTAAAH